MMNECLVCGVVEIWEIGKITSNFVDLLFSFLLLLLLLLPRIFEIFAASPPTSV